jgi:hypothetical protein
MKKVEKTPYHTQIFNVECGALIAISLVLLQDVLSSPSLDIPLTVTSCAFAIAIPLLSAKLMINFEESKAGYYVPSNRVKFLYWAGMGAAFVGINAAFWHLSWLIGSLFAISSLLAILFYITYVADAQLNTTEAQEAAKHGIRRLSWTHTRKEESDHE